MSLWTSQLRHKWTEADVALFTHPDRVPLRGEHCQPLPLPAFSLPREPALGGRCDSHMVRAAESVHGGIKCVRAAGCRPARVRNAWPLVALQESPAVVSLRERTTPNPTCYPLPSPHVIVSCKENQT